MEEESSGEIRRDTVVEVQNQMEEEERERRRLRDRQRRQSMTLEQRERHLARRRRNYQLRRLRADHYTPPPHRHHHVHTSITKLHTNIPLQEPGFGSGAEMVIANEHHHDVDCSGFDDPIGQERLNLISLKSVYQETVGGSAKTIRLSRVRCLARSLSYSRGSEIGGDFVNVGEVATTLQFGLNESTRLASGVRLNCVKLLARGFSTVNNEANVDNQDYESAQTIGNEDKTTRRMDQKPSINR